MNDILKVTHYLRICKNMSVLGREKSRERERERLSLEEWVSIGQKFWALSKFRL